jgi:butyrate kinase
MSGKYILMAINPGSTSTKVAVFEDEERLFGETIEHSAEALGAFAEIVDQYPYRKRAILEALARGGLSPAGMTAFVGRGGGLVACEGGTYPVNERLLEDAKSGRIAKHPATLGAVLAADFAREYGGAAYIVNPPDVDEMEDIARVGGLAALPRQSRFHALNQKEVALRACAEMGKLYAEVNLVVAHVGGGVSVSAHRRGRVVDTTDIVNGDCPMAPTRSGSLAPGAVVSMCFSGERTRKQMTDLILKNGGMVDHLGTSDVLEVKRRIEEGDSYAKLVYDAMIYQIGKSIGSYAAALSGEVDAILLTGGIARDRYLVDELARMVGFIASVKAFPGEFEMEALANGVLRVLRGTESPRTYTGVPVWSGFDAYRK